MYARVTDWHSARFGVPWIKTVGPPYLLVKREYCGRQDSSPFTGTFEFAVADRPFCVLDMEDLWPMTDPITEAATSADCGLPYEHVARRQQQPEGAAGGPCLAGGLCRTAFRQLARPTPQRDLTELSMGRCHSFLHPD